MKGNFWLLLLAFCASFAPVFGQTRKSETVVAQVNDDSITYGEVYDKIKDAIQGIENSQMSPRQKKLQKQKLFKIALRRIVDDRLILQEAKRYNIKVSEETVQKRVEQEIEAQGQEATGEVDLTNLIRSRLTLQELFQRKSSYSPKEQRRAAIDTYVSPWEIRHYYKTHPQEFSKEGKIKTRIITLFYFKHEGKERTLAKAESIVRELRRGADFAEMAKLYSNDPYAKEGGTWPRPKREGEIVWDFFTRGEALHREVEDIAFDMSAGEVSDPIALDNFCQIVKVEDVIPGGKEPFTAAQAKIRKKLRYVKVIAALSRIRDRLRERAYISPPDLFAQDAGQNR